LTAEQCSLPHRLHHRRGEPRLESFRAPGPRGRGDLRYAAKSSVEEEWFYALVIGHDRPALLHGVWAEGYADVSVSKGRAWGLRIETDSTDARFRPLGCYAARGRLGGYLE